MSKSVRFAERLSIVISKVFVVNKTNAKSASRIDWSDRILVLCVAKTARNTSSIRVILCILLLLLLLFIIIIILYSHRTVTDGLTPQAGVAITEGLTGGEKDGV